MTYRKAQRISQNLDETIIQHEDENGVVTLFDPDRDNTIGEQYRAWIAEGNTPEPAIELFPIPEPQSEPDHPAT
jgi:hypothetical protein